MGYFLTQFKAYQYFATYKTEKELWYEVWRNLCSTCPKLFLLLFSLFCFIEFDCKNGNFQYLSIFLLGASVALPFMLSVEYFEFRQSVKLGNFAASFNLCEAR